MATKLTSIHDPALRDKIRLGLECTEHHREKEPDKYELEADLQRDAEAYLEARGYLRITKTNLAAQRKRGTCKGWRFHMHDCKRNDIMPDITLYARNRKPLFIELKLRDRWQPGQKDAALLMGWITCWNMKDVRQALERWEKPTVRL